MLNLVVMAKQVPDTANLTGEAMKPDGTVNRAALPAIFNPEDLNALEMALTIRDRVGGKVHVITMGPPKAVDILKHALYLGADHVYLISDRRFAGADTLATSYVLAAMVRKLGNVDLVLAGRQAIDGDTAQVGPQTAEKLGINQITYVNRLMDVNNQTIRVERDGETQTEQIQTGYPVLLTVTSAANTPRYPNARRLLHFFRADLETRFTAQNLPTAQSNNWVIPLITADDLEIDLSRCGLGGSPTKVHKIKSIVLKGSDLKLYGTAAADIKMLVRDIMRDYVEALP